MTEAILKLLEDHPDWKIIFSSVDSDSLRLAITRPDSDGSISSLVVMISKKLMSMSKALDLLGLEIREAQRRLENG